MVSTSAKTTTAKRSASDATLRQFSGYAMKRSFNAVQADVNAALAPHGLRMLTFSALVIVVDNPGLRQSQLADALAIERPNLVLVVDELERADLIIRNPAQGDRRAYALTPTATGKQVYAQAIASVRAHEDKMTAALSEAERKSLHHALREIEIARGGDS